MLYGVDIHPQYQGGIDFTRLKAQGYSFMVTKASEGTSVPATKALPSAGFTVRMLAWIAQARKLGIVPGLYHWLKAGNAVAQAQFFHALVVRAGGPQGLLIQLDCEDNATYADVTAWAAEWRRLTGGHPVLLYTGGWWWRPRAWDGNAVTPYLWESHYLTADLDTIPDDPGALAAGIPQSWWTPGYGKWPAATILQFTSKGDAGGLGNNVDLNAFRGTLTQLLALSSILKGDNDMPFLAGINGSPAVWLNDGIAWHGMPDEATVKAMEARFGPTLWVDDGALLGLPPKDAPPATVTMSEKDKADIVAGLATQLKTSIDALRTGVRTDTRDAVGDFAEGGAVAVRAAP